MLGQPVFLSIEDRGWALPAFSCCQLFHIPVYASATMPAPGANGSAAHDVDDIDYTDIEEKSVVSC